MQSHTIGISFLNCQDRRKSFFSLSNWLSHLIQTFRSHAAWRWSYIWWAVSQPMWLEKMWRMTQNKGLVIVTPPTQLPPSPSFKRDNWISRRVTLVCPSCQRDISSQLTAELVLVKDLRHEDRNGIYSPFQPNCSWPQWQRPGESLHRRGK